MRSLFNFTKSKVVKASGLSMSTIKRYKRGEVVSQKSQEAIEKALRKLLRQEQAKLRKEILKRADAFKEARRWEGATGMESWGPAWDYFQNKLGGMDLLTARGKTSEEIARDLELAESFLERKTATVKGYKEWIRKLKKTAADVSGTDDPDQQKDFFEVFNMLKKEGNKYYANGVFQSEQAATDIRIAYAEFDEAGLPYDSVTIYEYLINERTIEYEKQQAMQQQLDTEEMFYKPKE